ncbi:thymidylate synthase [Candidatus Saccharibacteria bacterium]|nr:thymidylate synthase [Candidatus Saccharibacteria bacterium]
MVDTQYEDLLRKIKDTGVERPDRTGTGTLGLFSEHLDYDLSKGFPLITTKKVPFGLILSELLWFLDGDSNIKRLLEQKNTIWSEWPFKKYLLKTSQNVPEPNSPEWKEQIKVYEQNVLNDPKFAAAYGELGPVYGVQWVKWLTREGTTINQIENAVKTLKVDPYSRRNIVTAWNPQDLEDMALPPCHRSFQLYVAEGKVSIQVDQRSCDTVLGVPFNIASYALLVHMFARQSGLKVGWLHWIGGDVHIYKNHLEQVDLQLSREVYDFPELVIKNDRESIFDYEFDDFDVVGYKSGARIAAPIAV